MSYLFNSQPLDDAFKAMAQTVLINDEPQQAVITTAHLGEKERKHISSLQKFSQGDYVQFNDELYLIIEEVEGKRHNKYRATMALCNFRITIKGETIRVQIGKDEFGRPIYQTTNLPDTYVHGVINKADRRLQLTGQMSVVNSRLYIDVQDNPDNVTKLAVNKTFPFKDKAIKVLSHDRSNNGRLGLLVGIELP